MHQSAGDPVFLAGTGLAFWGGVVFFTFAALFALETLAESFSEMLSVLEDFVVRGMVLLLILRTTHCIIIGEQARLS